MTLILHGSQKDVYFSLRRNDPAIRFLSFACWAIGCWRGDRALRMGPFSIQGFLE
jgi:hypothetical protein